MGRPRANTSRRDDQIVRYYLAGNTTYQIAIWFELTRPRICQVLHERGIVARKWQNRNVTFKRWTTDRRYTGQGEGARSHDSLLAREAP